MTNDKLREALEQIKANCFRSDITDHTALAGIAIIAKEALAFTTVATSATDARAIVEQCAAIADQYGENSDWSWSPRKAPEAIAAAIRAKAPEPAQSGAWVPAEQFIALRDELDALKAALPKAGEVEPVAWRYERKDGGGGVIVLADRLTDCPDHLTETPLYATPQSVIPAAAVGEEAWKAKEREYIALLNALLCQIHDQGSDIVKALHDACITAKAALLPTPSEGLTERYRAALASLVKWADNIMRAQGVTARQKAVEEARAALATPEKDA